MKTSKQESEVDADNLPRSDLILIRNPRATIPGPVADDSGRTAPVHVAGGAVVVSTLHSEERELLALADGRHSVADLIRLSGMSAGLARKYLRGLCDRGVLVPSPSNGATVDAQGLPTPEDSESAAAADGSSALTRAIDEYLELAASALTDAAAADEANRSASVDNAPAIGPPVPEERDPSSTLSGMAPPPVFADRPAGSGTSEPGVAAGQMPAFRPNVTAFWLPSVSDFLANPHGPVRDSPLTPAGGLPTIGMPGSGPTVVVKGSTAGPAPSAGAGERPEGTATPGPRPAAGSDVAASAPGASPVAHGGAIPFRVGNYEVATRIAQGGMGSIYVCRRTGESGLQRLFTLKVVRQHSAQKEEAVRSFKREAQVGSLLSHPNLQTVLDVGSYKDQPFLILDYIEGSSLSDLISDERRAPVPVVIALLMDVLRGLHHAHQMTDEKGARRGLVHGDVSPQNVLVGVDGVARLTDFGSATFTGEGMVRDPRWVATGKPAYMAPEQLRAEPLDARTDVFATGVLLWSALTGQKLFAGDTYDETIIKVLRKKIPPPSAFGAPAAFDEICLRALSRSRDGRYASADEMARELSRVASNENLLASTADVGQWVRRESGESLGEQRRRIQFMFGSSKVSPARIDTSGRPPARVAPATIVLNAVPRGLQTPKVGANKALSSRTVFLPTVGRPQRSFWQTHKVVIVSALLALPVTLTIGYFLSNLLASRAQPAMAPRPASSLNSAASR